MRCERAASRARSRAARWSRLHASASTLATLRSCATSSAPSRRDPSCPALGSHRRLPEMGYNTQVD